MDKFYFIILIVISTLSIVVLWFEFKLIIDISKHYFLKVIGKIIIISIAFIALIFGIHSEIFSSYDKFNSKNEFSYNWLNPSDIFTFPIEQYCINNNYYQDKYTINVDSLFFKPQIINRKVTIVVDKTASILKKYKKSSFYNGQRTEIESYLNENVQNEKIIFDEVRIEDLFILSAIKKFSDDKLVNTSVEIMFYLGDDVYRVPFTDDILITSENLVEIFNSYKISAEKVNKEIDKNKVTNFKYIADRLNNNNWLGNCGDFDYTSLIILSDFVHEEMIGSSMNELDISLNALRINVDQVNLIKFQGSGSNPKISRNTVDLFRGAFNNIYYYEFDEELKNNLNYITQLGVYFSAIIESKKPFFLYRSWNDNDFSNNYKCNYIFKNISDNGLIIGLNSIIRPIRYKNEYSYMSVDSGVIKLIPLKYLKLDNNKKTHSFSFFTKDNDEYYLELYKPNYTTIVRKPIILKPVLPKTSSIYLIIMYVIFFFSFVSIFLYYIFLMHKSLLINKMRVFIVYPLLVAVILLSLVFISDIVVNILFIIRLNIKYIIPLILLLLGFYAVVFVQSYRNQPISKFNCLYEKEE